MRAWIIASVPLVLMACGGSFTNDTSSSGSPNVDGGPGTGGASSGGASAGGKAGTPTGTGGSGGGVVGGAPAAGGFTSAGGITSAGGATPVTGGVTGTGGMDCSNVGCGAPPLCSEGCLAPCGCCPCADGEHQIIGNDDHVCSGGCWKPAPPSVDGGAPCSHNGRTYDTGERFRAGDGCNTCTCTGGSVGCTDMACSCDPAAESHQRGYVGTSPGQCALLDFICAQNTTMFQNSCGCGCEQGLTCPDWFNCMPGSGQSCDPNQIKIDCPYSGIAF